MVNHAPHGFPSGPSPRGRLFSRSFLDRELPHTRPWQALHTPQLEATRLKMVAIVSGIRTERLSNGGSTQQGLIRPMLRCLGWRAAQRRQPPRPGSARQQSSQAMVALKTTPWQANLDQSQGHQPAPAACMVADLRRSGRPRWGILTNGNCWRLYDGQAPSVIRGFLEIHLLQALQQPELFKRFLVFFRPQAMGCPPGGNSWLEDLLTAHGRHQQRMATAFMQQACHRIFPALATAMAQAAPTVPQAVVREASLVLLYRLLFLLYGEGRGLLHAHGATHTATNSHNLHDLAALVAEIRRHGQGSPAEQPGFRSTMAALFPATTHSPLPRPARPEQPPFLFLNKPSPLLDGLTEAGKEEMVAHALPGLCFTRSGEPIDYGDLPVAQLGALYEQLMALRLKRGDGGGITLESSRLSRKTAGCYYTPRGLVDLVLQETVAPLLQGRSARQLLRLKICDPAMGTGNFLLGLLDHLADAVFAATASPPSSSVGNHQPPFRDAETVRSLVLQHCIYGVDKDPMAVDLARLALMLYGVGTNANHLDHHLLGQHLRCGNSLFGSWIQDAGKRIRDADGAATLRTLLQSHRRAAAPIVAMDTATLPTPDSAKHWRKLQKANEPLAAVLSAVHAGHWLPPSPTGGTAMAHDLWRGRWGNPVHLVTGVVPAPCPRLGQLLERLNVVGTEENFFHWQLAFPGLWPEGHHEGGFDAVIGNPPWDRVKRQQVEWFAQHWPDVAPAPHAAARRRRIARLQHRQAPQVMAYAHAAARAAAQCRAAKACGDYPLLSGGDLNVYALFMERAMALVKPRGLVGMLTPSSLASGKTGAGFFRRVAQQGGLRVLYDFENGKTFFPDIHGSFRFCVFVARKKPQRASPKLDGREQPCPLPAPSPSAFGGAARCAFRLRSIAELNDPQRRFLLRAEDFARVNPNTGTAPLFRTRRDARITTGIYGRLPVLVNRSGGAVSRPWPVTYRRMFDMGSQSHLFRSAPEDSGWLPLYEGKMMQAFDHRAADVVVNRSNLFRPAQQRLLQDWEKADPERRPRWRHYVRVDGKRWFWPAAWVVAFKDITSATNRRTMIAAVLPRAAVSHKLPLLVLNGSICSRPSWACFILANLNSIVFDFVVRQKLYGTSLTLHVLEQLPVVPPGRFHARIGSTTAAAVIRAAVLELTYTAWDLTAFARDLGHGGPPFLWNAQRRLHLRARLDALFFLLYGITSEAEIRYVYSTFPTMEREELALYGHYRSVEICLQALRAFQRPGCAPLSAGRRARICR